VSDYTLLTKYLLKHVSDYTLLTKYLLKHVSDYTLLTGRTCNIFVV